MSETKPKDPEKGKPEGGKKPKPGAVVVREAPQMPQTNPEALIAQAIDKGVSVDTMERLLAMRRELKAERAKELFDQDMAAFQGECPVIKKTKAGGQTNSGKVAYYYAPLDSIVSQVKDLIQEHGFSYSVKTETKEEGVKVTCVVKHEAGHSEESTVEVPLGSKTNVMSASQVVASAITFAKRYAFCNAFGILTGDDDDDSNTTKTPEGTKTPEKTEKRKKTAFEKLMEMVKTETPAVLKEYKAKMEKSDKYTEDQKAQFCIAVEDKLKELGEK